MHWLSSNLLGIAPCISYVVFLSLSGVVHAQEQVDDREDMLEEAQFSPTVDNSLALPNSTKPVVVYSVIDTPETLMQLAVDFELRQFFAHCGTVARENWIAFVNSYLTNNGGEIVYCKDGKRKNILLSETDKPFYERITEKVKALTDPRFTYAILRERLLFPFMITEHNEPYRALYAKYPMANADVMYHLLNWMNKKDLFPPQQFTKFFHFKAHAVPTSSTHLNILLTGLDDDVLKEKIADQKQQWDSIKAAYPRAPDLPPLALGQAGKGPLPLDLEWINALGIGQIDSSRSYANYLRGGFKDGLSRRYGLGASNFFGIDANSFLKMMSKLSYDTDVKSTLITKDIFGFILLEGCHANIANNLGLRLSMATQTLNTKAIYSPTGTLWYRNVNWDEVLNTPGATTNNERMYHALVVATSLIRNYYTTKDKSP